MEWVEVAGKTVEDAVVAGLEELGIDDREQAVIEVLQEPKSGFLGIGSQLAHVKVSPKPKDQGRKRRRRRRKPRGENEASETSARESGADSARASSEARSRQQSRSGGGNGQQKRGEATASAGSGSGRSRTRDQGGKQSQKRNGRGGSGSSKSAQERSTGKAAAMTQQQEGRTEATIEERAEVAATFIKGLLDAFGLEGDVATEIDEDILKINVSGDQTEALVGPKGSVMQSVLEVTRTVVQRKTYGAPRIRLDIAGYAERRREALKIYAGKLAEQVLADGGEIMLEPMNPADRKVIHDAVSEIDGVRSFSEGEDPDRAVVLAPE